jgi:hypothetical protein
MNEETTEKILLLRTARTQDVASVFNPDDEELPQIPAMTDFHRIELERGIWPCENYPAMLLVDGQEICPIEFLLEELYNKCPELYKKFLQENQ